MESLREYVLGFKIALGMEDLPYTFSITEGDEELFK